MFVTLFLNVTLVVFEQFLNIFIHMYEQSYSLFHLYYYLTATNTMITNNIVNRHLKNEKKTRIVIFRHFLIISINKL